MATERGGLYLRFPDHPLRTCDATTSNFSIAIEQKFCAELVINVVLW